MSPEVAQSGPAMIVCSLSAFRAKRTCTMASLLRTDTPARTLSRRLHPVLPFAIVAANQKPREDFAMTRWATLAIGFLAFCSSPVTGPAQAQSGEGWIMLFDGKNLDHW